MSTRSVEQRLTEIEDREAIREVFANYCYGLDKRDETVFMSLWSEDGAYDVGEQWGGRSEGIEKVRELIHNIWAVMPKSSHYTTNTVVNLIDASHAEGRSDVWATCSSPDGTPMINSASYQDKLIKLEGNWKITERKVTIHYSAPVAEVWNLVQKSS